MAEAIVPMGHGERTVWRQAAGLHVVASAAAAALVGLVLGAAGVAVPARVRLVLLVVVAAWAALREGVFPGWIVPGPHRQVPRSWGEDLGLRTAASAYGAGLGLAVATRVTTASVWAALAAAFASGGAGTAAAIARDSPKTAPMAVVGVTGRLDSWDAARRLQSALDRSEVLSRRVVAVLSGALALAAVTALVSL